MELKRENNKKKKFVFRESGLQEPGSGHYSLWLGLCLPLVVMWGWVSSILKVQRLERKPSFPMTLFRGGNHCFVWSLHGDYDQPLLFSGAMDPLSWIHKASFCVRGWSVSPQKTVKQTTVNHKEATCGKGRRSQKTQRLMTFVHFKGHGSCSHSFILPSSGAFIVPLFWVRIV